MFLFNPVDEQFYPLGDGEGIARARERIAGEALGYEKGYRGFMRDPNNRGAILVPVRSEDATDDRVQYAKRRFANIQQQLAKHTSS